MDKTGTIKIETGFHDHVEDQRNILKYRRKMYGIFFPLIVSCYIIFVSWWVFTIVRLSITGLPIFSLLQKQLFILFIISVGMLIFYFIYSKDKKIFFHIGRNNIFIPEYPMMQIDNLDCIKIDVNIRLSKYIHIWVIIIDKNGSKIPLFPSYVDMIVINDIIRLLKMKNLTLQYDLRFIIEEMDEGELKIYQPLIDEFNNKQIDLFIKNLNEINKDNNIINIQSVFLESWLDWLYFHEPKRGLELLESKRKTIKNDYLEILRTLIRHFPNQQSKEKVDN
jgi:hypothetical protein